jgi:WD40 repeat protein
VRESAGPGARRGAPSRRQWGQLGSLLPNGQQLASASSDSAVRLWNTVAGRCLQTLEGHSGGVNSVAFSPNGQQLASASSDSTVRLWEAATGTFMRTINVGHTLASLSFHIDSCLLTDIGYMDVSQLPSSVLAAPQGPTDDLNDAQTQGASMNSSGTSVGAFLSYCRPIWLRMLR